VYCIAPVFKKGFCRKDIACRQAALCCMIVDTTQQHLVIQLLHVPAVGLQFGMIFSLQNHIFHCRHNTATAMIKRIMHRCIYHSSTLTPSHLRALIQTASQTQQFTNPISRIRLLYLSDLCEGLNYAPKD